MEAMEYDISYAIKNFGNDHEVIRTAHRCIFTASKEIALAKMVDQSYQPA